jgi:HJR/Mrr/RecB family endonuclease
MLTENDVIEVVVSHLKQGGWVILNTCSTGQHGVDILREQGGRRLAIEAKGGTSATMGTKRYGKPFTANQKRTLVAVAFLTAAQSARF